MGGPGRLAGMGFFERNRAALAERGIDPARLPPGQYSTERFPVLHGGDVPTYAPDRSDWSLTVGGLVANPRSFSWTDLLALPATEIVTDIHCVTKWSKFDTTWKGVRFHDLLDACGGALPAASHVVETAEHGYTSNVGRCGWWCHTSTSGSRRSGSGRSSCSTTTSSASGSGTGTTRTATRSAS